MNVFKRIGLLLAMAICFNLGGCATQLALAALQHVQSAHVKTYMDRENDRALKQTYGNKIDPIKVAQIKHGVTTRTQVEDLFGPPQNVAMMGDGKRMMMYNYGTILERHTLQIALDSTNVVQDHEYSVVENTTARRTLEDAGISLSPATEKK